MKNVKFNKVMTLILLMVVVVGSSAIMGSCGNDKDFVGKWTVSKVIYGGEEVPVGDEPLIIEIKSNGDAVFGADGTGDVETTLKWTEKDGKMTIADPEDDSVKIEGEIVDGKLEIIDGDSEVTLEKK